MTTSASYRLVLRRDAGGAVRWAVVAANGRTLGTAVEGSLDPATASGQFALICPQLPDLTVSFGRADRSQAWYWLAGNGDDGYLARSGQTYERHSTARAAYARFTVAAATLCGVDTPSRESP